MRASAAAVAELGERHADAVTALQQGLALARRQGTGLQLEANMLAHLAAACLAIGDGERARAHAEEAVAVARRRHLRYSECLAEIVRTRVLRGTDGARARSAIEGVLERADALVEETGARALAPHVLRERAALARLVGDPTTAERQLREAHRLFTEMGATGWAERVAKELGA